MQFKSFTPIPRLARMAVYTEKIDGTSGLIAVSPTGDTTVEIYAGSRERFLTKAMVFRQTGDVLRGSELGWVDVSANPSEDNYGFGKWVEDNAAELVSHLGPGYHYGEWWGQGIGREYGLKEKRFSLFNTGRWARSKKELESPPAWATSKWQLAPPCCHVVPVIDYKEFSTKVVDQCLFQLSCEGSHAAPGFMNPEGVVVAHIDKSKGATMFKKTFNGDKK